MTGAHQLYAMRPHAVTALNRAVAIGEMRGAAAGLDPRLARRDPARGLPALPRPDILGEPHASVDNRARPRVLHADPDVPPGIEDARHDVAA